MDYVEYTMNIHFKYNRSQQFFLYPIHVYIRIISHGNVAYLYNINN
jgi:hypothetical protein